MSPPDLVSSLPLPADASAPAAARRHSREVLRRWQLRELIEPTLLVVSELVTNAVRHGRPPVRLRLRGGERDVRVEVQDAYPTLGADAATGKDAESGRGLEIVKALASSCGIEPVPEDGKVAWAQLNAESSEEPTGQSPPER